MEEPFLDWESYYQNSDSKPIDQIKPIKGVCLIYAWCYFELNKCDISIYCLWSKLQPYQLPVFFCEHHLMFNLALLCLCFDSHHRIFDLQGP